MIFSPELFRFLASLFNQDDIFARFEKNMPLLNSYCFVKKVTPLTTLKLFE